MTTDLVEIKREILKELYNKIHYYESIDDEDLGICGVCGELYNRKVKGVTCSSSCYREKYMS